MYPYRNRWRWFMFGRYAHLAKAINERKTPLQDTVLESRVGALMRWNRIRFGVSLLLSLGILAAAGAWIAARLPSAETASVLLDDTAALSSAAAGVLTVAYLFFSRLLGQIEADILTILTVGHRK